MFDIGQHGTEKLGNFLDLSPSQYTVLHWRPKKDRELPSLDILIYKTKSGRFGYKIYRNQTHTTSTYSTPTPQRNKKPWI